MIQTLEIHFPPVAPGHPQPITSSQVAKTLAEYDSDAIVYMTIDGVNTPATVLYLSNSNAIVITAQGGDPPTTMTATDLINFLGQYSPECYVVLWEDNNSWEPVFSRKGWPVVLAPTTWPSGSMP